MQADKVTANSICEASWHRFRELGGDRRAQSYWSGWRELSKQGVVLGPSTDLWKRTLQAEEKNLHTIQLGSWHLSILGTHGAHNSCTIIFLSGGKKLLCPARNYFLIQTLTAHLFPFSFVKLVRTLAFSSPGDVTGPEIWPQTSMELKEQFERDYSIVNLVNKLCFQNTFIIDSS